MAFYVDAATFALSALMIWTLPLPRRRKEDRRTSGRRIEFGSALRELREGWEFVFINPVVRAVNLGLATGLIGGGMLVPLGPVFAEDVLGSGQSGFGALIFALGLGVAAGVVAVSVLQRRLPKEWLFVGAVFIAGLSLFLAASMSTIETASAFVFVLGVCAGTVYVLGFTMLHQHVEDELRGRIFSALYTLVRLCVLISFAVGPFLSEILGELSSGLFPDGHAGLLGISIAVPGVRLTLWAAALIIVGAGFIAASSMRDAAAQGSRRSARHRAESAAGSRVSDPGVPSSGRFLAFEGGEAAGKSTQASRLSSRTRRGADPGTGWNGRRSGHQVAVPRPVDRGARRPDRGAADGCRPRPARGHRGATGARRPAAMSSPTATSTRRWRTRPTLAVSIRTRSATCHCGRLVVSSPISSCCSTSRSRWLGPAWPMWLPTASKPKRPASTSGFGRASTSRPTPTRTAGSWSTPTPGSRRRVAATCGAA